MSGSPKGSAGSARASADPERAAPKWVTLPCAVGAQIPELWHPPSCSPPRCASATAHQPASHCSSLSFCQARLVCLCEVRPGTSALYNLRLFSQQLAFVLCENENPPRRPEYSRERNLQYKKIGVHQAMAPEYNRSRGRCKCFSRSARR